MGSLRRPSSRCTTEEDLVSDNKAGQSLTGQCRFSPNTGWATGVRDPRGSQSGPPPGTPEGPFQRRKLQNCTTCTHVGRSPIKKDSALSSRRPSCKQAKAEGPGARRAESSLGKTRPKDGKLRADLHSERQTTVISAVCLCPCPRAGGAGPWNFALSGPSTASFLPRGGPPAHRKGKGVAVSLGTPADRHSQIRIPTCSGRRHYFSLFSSRVTQEQREGPGLTVRIRFLPETRRQEGGSKGRYALGADAPSKHLNPWLGHPSFFLPTPGPGQVLGLSCAGCRGSLFPPSHAHKPQLPAQSSSRAVRKPSSTDHLPVTILLLRRWVLGGHQTGKAPSLPTRGFQDSLTRHETNRKQNYRESPGGSGKGWGVGGMRGLF